MNRRQGLQLLALAGANVLLREFTGGRSSLGTVIYDGRYPEALALASRAEQALDCRGDAALLWYSQIMSGKPTALLLRGMTLPADAMVLADCARRESSAFEWIGAPPGRHRLVEWVIRRSASV